MPWRRDSCNINRGATARGAPGMGASTDFASAGHLITALQDRSEKVRAEAARSLGRLRARQATHPLTNTLLRDPRAPVREEAARALGEIGDERALDALSRALTELPTR